MKISSLILFGCLTLTAPVWGDVAQYEFNGNLDSSSGGASLTTGFAAPALSADVAFTNVTIGGQAGQAAAFTAGTYFTMSHGLGANGGGSKLNQYTLLFDVMFPSQPTNSFTVLFQTNPQNTNDGDWWINASRKLGVAGIYGGTVANDTWNRLAVVVDDVAGTLTGFINGTPVHTNLAAAGGLGIDGRWALASNVLLFADESGQMAPGFVNSVQLQPVAMTASAIAALGGATAAGIPLPDGTNTPPVTNPPPASSDPFTLVVIPDSQMMVAGVTYGGHPEQFVRQIAWIKTNVAPLNIQFVSHVGDVVDGSADLVQWDRAVTAMYQLDGVVPYGIAPGNHDGYMLGDTDCVNFNTYFPAAKFSTNAWYGGSYPATNNKNSYQLFTAGGMNFIIIHLGYNPNDIGARNWAAGLLTTYASRKAIISTHAFLKEPAAITWEGQKIWDDVVKAHDNVFLLVCGHNLREATLVMTNNFGHPVYTIMSNYQYDNPQTGWLRYYKFIPTQNKIEAYTLSTETLTFEVDAASRFDIPFDFGAPLVTNGVNATILAGTQVSWTASSANSYQPQKSSDNSVWTDFGALLAGNAITSRFDTVKSPFYRVLELTPGSGRVLNSGFETAGATPAEALNWTVAQAAGGPVYAVRTNNNPRSGSSHFEVRLASTGGGPVVEFQQAGVPVNGSTSYPFTFYANALTGSAGHTAQWKILWNVGGDTGYRTFTPGNNVYTLISNAVTAPAAATSATLVLRLAGAASVSQSATIQLDDIALGSGGGPPGATNVLSASVQPGLEISWPTEVGSTYQVKSSTNLDAFVNFGPIIIGDGNGAKVTDLRIAPAKFYRLEESNRP